MQPQYIQYSSYHVTLSLDGREEVIRHQLAAYGARDVEKVREMGIRAPHLPLLILTLHSNWVAPIFLLPSLRVQQEFGCRRVSLKGPRDEPTVDGMIK